MNECVDEDEEEDEEEEEEEEHKEAGKPDKEWARAVGEAGSIEIDIELCDASPSISHRTISRWPPPAAQ